MAALSQNHIIYTKDGSHTLSLLDKNEHYHSTFGALSESLHIFITHGLNEKTHKKELNILEVGFGTGLNALLTLMHKGQTSILYHAIEPFPIDLEIVEKLNYPNLLNAERFHFENIHRKEFGCLTEIESNFKIKKINEKIEHIILNQNFFDLVYFDMFNPDLCPELWQADIFLKLYNSLKTDGLLLTYSAKGAVRRAMKEAGFSVEKLPGPEGKREITRCRKNT